MEVKKVGLIEATEKVNAAINGYEVSALITYTNEGVREISKGEVVKNEQQVASFQRWGSGSKSIGYTTPDEVEQDNIHAMLQEFFAGVDAMFNAQTL